MLGEEILIHKHRGPELIPNSFIICPLNKWERYINNIIRETTMSLDSKTHKFELQCFTS